MVENSIGNARRLLEAGADPNFEFGRCKDLPRGITEMTPFTWSLMSHTDLPGKSMAMLKLLRKHGGATPIYDDSIDSAIVLLGFDLALEDNSEALISALLRSHLGEGSDDDLSNANWTVVSSSLLSAAVFFGQASFVSLGVFPLCPPTACEPNTPWVYLIAAHMASRCESQFYRRTSRRTAASWG